MRSHNIQEIGRTGKVPGQLFLLLLMFATLGQVTADLYLPSLPAIAKTFEISSSWSQLTLAIYFFGFGLSHLFYGPWSDAVGRRRPLLTGVGLSILGSLICCFSPNIVIFILGRALQGLGLGSCNSVGRSVIRDLVSGHYLSRLGGQMGMASSFTIAIAPTLGGYIEHYASWRFGFAFILVYSAAVLLLLWRALPETHQSPNPEAILPRILLQNYRKLFCSRVFMGYVICSGIAYSGVVAYMTSAPFLLQVTLGVSPIAFGWLAFLNASGIFASGLVNSRYVSRYGVATMLLSGICLMILGSSVMLTLGLLGFLNVSVIVFPMLVFCIGVGLTFQNASAGALESFGQIAGSAAAVYGLLQILAGALVGTVISLLHEKTQMPLAVTQFSLAILATLAWRIGSRASKRDLPLKVQEK